MHFPYLPNPASELIFMPFRANVGARLMNVIMPTKWRRQLPLREPMATAGPTCPGKGKGWPNLPLTTWSACPHSLALTLVVTHSLLHPFCSPSVLPRLCPGGTRRGIPVLRGMHGVLSFSGTAQDEAFAFLHHTDPEARRSTTAVLHHSWRAGKAAHQAVLLVRIVS